MYWGLTMGSMVVGNFISALFIDKTNQSTMIVSMAIICLISIVGLPYLFLYENEKLMMKDENDPLIIDE